MKSTLSECKALLSLECTFCSSVLNHCIFFHLDKGCLLIAFSTTFSCFAQLRQGLRLSWLQFPGTMIDPGGHQTPLQLSTGPLDNGGLRGPHSPWTLNEEPYPARTDGPGALTQTECSTNCVPPTQGERWRQPGPHCGQLQDGALQSRC